MDEMPGRIPVTRFYAYCAAHGVDGEVRDQWEYLVSEMDGEYLKVIDERRSRSTVEQAVVP